MIDPGKEKTPPTMLNRRCLLKCCIFVTVILVVFSPYIFDYDGGREEYNNSGEGDEVRDNLLLKGADLIAIGSSMPLMFTVSLNMVWPILLDEQRNARASKEQNLLKRL